MLREHFDVDLGTDWTARSSLERIGAYHGILIRSATKLDAELIERADNLRVIGRAGVGVDNVDVAAATKRGIIVANAPQSNIVAAAEHTLALMLALARNIPQAHASLTSGKWERCKFGGTEVEGKTLGILGFGRIGQLVASARAPSACASSPSTRSSAPSASASSASRRPRPRPTLYAAGDFITLHLPKTPETAGLPDAETLAQCKDGVRIINFARGAADRRRGPAGGAGLRQGRRRRARRLRQGADHRPPALRLPQRGRHAAPRRLAPPRRRTAPACRPPSRSSPRSPAASSRPP